MASIFKKLFRNRAPKIVERADILSGSSTLSPFSGNAYESDIYRSAVDAIARNAAKLKPVHIVTMQGQKKEGDNTLNRILQIRPNPYMTTYDVIYKLVTHYYLYNNSFAYLDKDSKGDLRGIYPLRPLNIEYLTDSTGTLYCKFLFQNGNEHIFPYSDVLTLKRHFNGNDLLGDNNTAIIPTLDLAHTQSEGLKSSIKASATIRGLLKYNQVLSPEKLKQEKEAFINDYLTASNNGGIAAIDSKYDYTPLKNEPYVIDDKQLQAIKNKIYDYLGISESIVNSSYNEDEWAAFYESVIEPLGIQIGLELTDKIFTPREQAFGNSILLEANKLQFASTKTKNELIFNLLPMGILSINEAREILNVPAIEGGDKYIQSLNYVDKDIINKYQLKGEDPIERD